MKKSLIWKRIIHAAMMGVFTNRQLRIVADKLLHNPTYSISQALGHVHIKQMRNKAETVKRVHLLESRQNIDQLLDDYQKKGVGICTIFDDDYPPGLAEIYDAPIVLFYCGNWKLTRSRRLGIVGSRKSTEYGKQVLNRLLPPLVEKQVTTISGLAAGIDQLTHGQTIRLGGQTIAVIGTGLDVAYPKEHIELQKLIAKNHLLISEYPLGTKPARYHFPMRNRIISGLSHGVVVVEAKQKSGSLITANVALQENREVFAVPGNILSSAYTGTNELIRAGAKTVLTADDIFEELHALWQLK